jgi:hypothetical protein
MSTWETAVEIAHYKPSAICETVHADGLGNLRAIAKVVAYLCARIDPDLLRRRQDVEVLWDPEQCAMDLQHIFDPENSLKGDGTVMEDSRMQELITSINERAAAYGVTNPTREDLAEAYRFLSDELMARHGITDEDDIAVALALILSAVVGFESNEIPPLQFKEPGAADKRRTVDKIIEALRPF